MCIILSGIKRNFDYSGEGLFSSSFEACLLPGLLTEAQLGRRKEALTLGNGSIAWATQISAHGWVPSKACSFATELTRARIVSASQLLHQVVLKVAAKFRALGDELCEIGLLLEDEKAVLCLGKLLLSLAVFLLLAESRFLGNHTRVNTLLEVIKVLKELGG